MSVVIEQIFPLGRFQARRWNQPPFDPNSIEWPPSPWRLLRAIAARWFQYCRETGADDTGHRDRILAKLAETMPSFRLPTETTSGPELRQYQPTEVKFTKLRTEPEMRRPLTTLMPDRSHALPSDEAILWVWKEAVLLPDERNLLAELLRRMHYFGRAESWTRLRLRDEEQPMPDANCAIEASASFGTLPLLVNASSDNLIERLLKPTGDKALTNRSIPAGTAWQYAKVPAKVGSSVVRGSRLRLQPSIQVARFALDSTVLPLVTETLPVAEAARRALMSIHGRLTEHNGARGRSPTFSGKDKDGKPLTRHGHAYYLPTDEDSDGRIDHLTLFARDGFGPEERRALDKLRQLNTGRKGEERHPLRLLLLGMGTLKAYHAGPVGQSKVWVSATPYIATRHAKTRGRDRVDLSSPQARAEFLIADLRDQIRAVLRDFDGNADHVQIDPILDGGGFKVAGRWRPIQFKRFRSRKNGDDGSRRLVGAFRIVFPQPVAGPIALGHSSHFGMGLFVPGDQE